MLVMRSCLYATSDSFPVTSEEVTARRRAERQQFKRDRARALAEAAAAAEAAFATTGEILAPEAQKANVPSAATWKAPPRTHERGIGDGTANKTAGTKAAVDIGDDENDSAVEGLEHLQLTLPEAFFLSW